MKKRLFALCAMGMVMLSGCGSSGTAPAEVADNAATGGAAAVETYTPAESVASESSMDYGFSEPAAAATAAPAAVSGKAVKAPIVGTFYAAPSPESKPFVSVGDRVKKGDIIFIIESMKVMSEVPSEFDGVVKEICVNNGDAVEFDQTIMILE